MPLLRVGWQSVVVGWCATVWNCNVCRAERAHAALRERARALPSHPPPPARRSPKLASAGLIAGVCVVRIRVRVALSARHCPCSCYPHASRTVSFVMMACMPMNCSFSKVSIDASWYIACSVDRCSMEASNIW